MKKGKKLYEGKAKIIYATSDKNLVIHPKTPKPLNIRKIILNITKYAF